MILGHAVVHTIAKAPDLALLAVNPARGMHVDGFERCLYPVFVLEPLGDHVELQHANGAQDHVVVVDRAKHLGGAFFTELVEAFVQGFRLERVAQDHALEQFRRKVRNAGELQILAL